MNRAIPISILVAALLVAGAILYSTEFSPQARVIRQAQDNLEKLPSAAMKSDLRNLDTAEDEFFRAHHTYSSDLVALNYRASPGVQILIREATGTNWRAAAYYGASSRTCSMSHGIEPTCSP